jgi:hypothetical protein
MVTILKCAYGFTMRRPLQLIVAWSADRRPVGCFAERYGMEVHDGLRAIHD